MKLLNLFLTYSLLISISLSSEPFDLKKWRNARSLCIPQELPLTHKRIIATTSAGIGLLTACEVETSSWIGPFPKCLREMDPSIVNIGFYLTLPMFVGCATGIASYLSADRIAKALYRSKTRSHVQAILKTYSTKSPAELRELFPQKTCAVVTSHQQGSTLTAEELDDIGKKLLESIILYPQNNPQPCQDQLCAETPLKTLTIPLIGGLAVAVNIIANRLFPVHIDKRIPLRIDGLTNFLRSNYASVAALVSLALLTAQILITHRMMYKMSDTKEIFEASKTLLSFSQAALHAAPVPEEVCTLIADYQKPNLSDSDIRKFMGEYRAMYGWF